MFYLLFSDLLESITNEQALCSTPKKQVPPTLSFLQFSPLKEDAASELSSESSGSDNEEDSSYCSSEASVDSTDCAHDYLAAFCIDETVHEEEATGDESIHESDYSVTLTNACALNDVKIHEYNDLSVNEGIVKIMDLYIQNKLSKAGLERSIETVCSLLPEDHNLPTSSHLILEYIESLAPQVPGTIHYYCDSCLFYHGTDKVGDCTICGAGSTFGQFFNFSVAALIKFFFENRNLASILDSETTNNSDQTGLKHLKDGSVYKDLNRDRGKYDVNVILNSDGVRIRKGSRKELWLVMFTIAELPEHLKKSFLSVIGVWYDIKKPDMKTLLRPFAEEMESLDQAGGGVSWIHPITKEVHYSRVRLLVTVLDAPARAITQNTMHFNSKYGCNLCETKATLTAHIPGLKRVRRFQYVHRPILRTKERMLNQASRVGNKVHVKGVKGPSILAVIPSADVSKCIVPEYLHSVLIGTCKQLLTIWTSKPGPWSVKSRISEIDCVLNTFKHPSFIHRSKRYLKSLKYWKASDFYYFLLFEGLLTLTNFLPDLYLQHFTLLVLGIYKLLKTCITEADIAEADLLLRLFVIDIQRLYGERELTYNSHQLLHLALCVRRYGPLHCWSAFIYEDLNGLIAKSTHGTHQIDVEIVRNIKICQGIHMLRHVVRGHHGLNDTTDHQVNIEFLGKKVNIQLSAEELLLLHDENPSIYSRAKIGYDVFSSELYKSLQSENFYVMWTDNGNPSYGVIKCFARTTTNDEFVVVRLLTVDHTKVFYHRETLKCAEHFIPVENSQRLVAMKIKDILRTLVKVGKFGSFIYKRPNLYRYVL